MIEGLRAKPVSEPMRKLLACIAKNPSILGGDIAHKAGIPTSARLLKTAERMGYVEWNPMSLGWTITDHGVHQL